MIFKNGDEPEAAISDGSIYGPWRDAGRPTSEWTEKAQFFGHGDETLLLAMTGGPDLRHPAVFRRERAGSLTRWIKDHDLDIPREKFNSLEIANAGVILGPETGLLPDQSADNQFFYFIYSGRTEDSSLAGQGDNRLGIARSVDLVHWEVPR